jgi:hypothetical protein
MTAAGGFVMVFVAGLGVLGLLARLRSSAREKKSAPGRHLSVWDKPISSVKKNR